MIDMSKITVATFYKFTELEDLAALRAELLDFCEVQGIRGTILIGHEGINATVAGPEFGVFNLLRHLKSKKQFEGLTAKFSRMEEIPFRRMKVRIKKEIVTLGVDGVEPAKLTGPHIPSKEWNEIISDPETVVLDTRNIYETKIGTFKGAIVPPIESFSDFPKYVKENLDPKKHKKIAMFCTGGIRCEKAAAWMLQEGFHHVVQLDGGILKYFEDMPKDQSLWDGDCYVFDGRMAVDPDLKPAGYVICPTCRWPVSEEERLDPDFEEGVTCPHCKHSAPPETIEASRERKKQMELAAKHGKKHLG